MAGKRESQLLKSLQRIQTKLPTAASLAAALAAAEAAKRSAEPKQATVAAKPADAQQATASIPPAEPKRATAQQAGDAIPAELPPGPSGAAQPSMSTAQPNMNAEMLSGANLNGQTDEQPTPMDLDVQSLQPQPIADTAQHPSHDAAGSDRSEQDVQMQQTAVAAPSSRDSCREDIRAFHSSLAPEAFEAVKGTSDRQSQWLMLLSSAARPQVLTLYAYYT